MKDANEAQARNNNSRPTFSTARSKRCGCSLEGDKDNKARHIHKPGGCGRMEFGELVEIQEDQKTPIRISTTVNR